MISRREKNPIVSIARSPWPLLVIVLLFASCLLPGCSSLPGQNQSTPNTTQPASLPEVATPATPFVFITPTPKPTIVGSVAPTGSVIPLSSPHAAPADLYAPHPVRPNAMATATFFRTSYFLQYNDVASLVTVDRGPFVIEFWTQAYNKNPYDTIVVITVKNPETGEIIAEDGFNGRYSSDPYKRMIIRDSGRFLVDIYGTRASIAIKLRGGVNESAAEPYGIMDIPFATRPVAL